MPDPRSRVRVERILRGDFRPDDLISLLLFARDHCDGRETVAEIGHFVAHQTERNKGIVTRSTREWFALARYFMAGFGPNGSRNLDASRLPASAQEYFRSAVTRIGGKLLREKTGIPGSRADKILQDLAARLDQNSDGTWMLPRECSPDEIALVNCISSYMVVRPAFSSQRLRDEFVDTLKSNGLITKDEIREYREEIGTLVQLLAIAVMHKCRVLLSDGLTTTLEASLNKHVGAVEILASVPNAVPGMPNCLIASAMFSANIDLIRNCHPDLLAGGRWDCEIELSPDKRLSPLI